jgi:hypothetical protein
MASVADLGECLETAARRYRHPSMNSQSAQADGTSRTGQISTQALTYTQNTRRDLEMDMSKKGDANINDATVSAHPERA